jgi:hypothetical protein
VTSVLFQRTSFSGEERVMVTAGLTSRSASSEPPGEAEIDGRWSMPECEHQSNASGSVVPP